MNLVQVQEHLKDVPMQALMSYANGASQMVPPYLALGEMNRRKQMEQRAAQPPKATVKDELEQQAQPATMMPNQGMTTMQPPEEEEGYASGGITGLPANFHFDVGGIVSFAGGSKDAVSEPEFDEEGLPLSKSQKAALLGKKSDIEDAIQADLARDQVVKMREARMNLRNPYQQDVNPDLVRGMQEFYKPRGTGIAEPIVQTSAPSAPAAPNIAPAQNTQVSQNINARPNVQPSAPAPGIAGTLQGAPSAPQGQGIAQSTNPFMAQLLKNVQATPETLPDFEARRKAAEANDAYLTKKPGELMEGEIANQRKRQEEARQRFEENEKAKTRSDLWANLIKAGKATAGKKGLGALVGGYGEAAIESEEAARQRREQFENLDNEKNLNFSKMTQEIENARIARSEGRFSDALKHETEAKKFKREGEKIQSESAGIGAKVLSDEQMARDRNAATLKAAGMPTGEERSLNKFVDSWLSQPENKGKTYADAVAAYKTIVSGGKLDVDRIAKAESAYNRDPEVKMLTKRNETFPSKTYEQDVKRLRDIMKEKEDKFGVTDDVPPPNAVRKVGK
jgi:hypothetical protein